MPWTDAQFFPFPPLPQADPSTFTGSAEAKFLLANLRKPTNLTQFAGYCTGHATTGKLLGEKVVIVTTGEEGSI